MSDLERRFDGPIPAHMLETEASRRLAERGALTMLERMLDEYLDEADRLQRKIAESEDQTVRAIAEQRLDSANRNVAWARAAIAAKKTPGETP